MHEIKTYPAESGIRDLIAANASIACGCSFEVIESKRELPQGARSEALSHAQTLTQYRRPDLTFIRFKLVSTGLNRNDDCLLPQELFSARTTPLHKPLNWRHQPDAVIGHMVGVYLQDFEGNRLSDEIEQVGYDSRFDLVSIGALYAKWKEKELQARADEIIAGIQEQRIAASMEAWLSDYDFLLIDETKGTKHLIKRNPETAFLSNHLRIYDGSGTFRGRRLFRVLRDLTFCGAALLPINKQANPRSTIIEHSDTELAAALMERINAVEAALARREPAEHFEASALLETHRSQRGAPVIPDLGIEDEDAQVRENIAQLIRKTFHIEEA